MFKKYSFSIFLAFLIIYFIFATNVNSQSNEYKNYYSPEINSTSNHESVLIILDSSYSMEDEINGERKVDMAKRVINQVLSKLSPGVWVGLRVYGHKTGFLGFNACRASELKVAIGPNNQSLISNELNKIKPVGMTPITYSIEQAIDNDFINLSGKKRIILVSDGMETCDGSPCDYALDLVRKKIDFKIDVVGLDLSDTDAVNQLKCTALSTKGKFYAASNAQELSDSLSKSLNTRTEVQGKILNKR